MKTALITGANKSIGFETARQLAQKGYFVYIGSRDLEKGQKAAAQLQAEGFSNVEAIQLDVSNKDSIRAAQQWLSQKITALDVLVNNAGISGGFDQKPSLTNTDKIREVFDTNFFGVIDVTQVFLSLLSKSALPVIVNVTSGLASLTLHSDPSWQFYSYKGASYGPSKTALNAYTVALAYELKETAFKVNVVDPGFTATDFNNHHGIKNVEDSASFVAKYAMLEADGPTGKYFSHDYEPNNNESPW